MICSTDRKITLKYLNSCLPRPWEGASNVLNWPYSSVKFTKVKYFCVVFLKEAFSHTAVILGTHSHHLPLKKNKINVLYWSRSGGSQMHWFDLSSSEQKPVAAFVSKSTVILSCWCLASPEKFWNYRFLGPAVEQNQNLYR